MVVILAAIQARMGSSRFPGKVLAPLGGSCALDIIYRKLKSITGLLDEVAVATSESQEDDQLISHLTRNSFKFFRGPESDVLTRFLLLGRQFNADHIVRVTADCPMLDVQLVSETIQVHLSERNDYTAVCAGAGTKMIKDKAFPNGMDCEIFSFSVLESISAECTDEALREHVTPGIWLRPQVYKCRTIASPADYSEYRFTLDTPADLKFLSEFFDLAGIDAEKMSVYESISLIDGNQRLKDLMPKNPAETYWKD